MVKLIKENNLLILSVICYIFQVFFLINCILSLIDFPNRLNLNLGDHWIYQNAIERYWQNINPFQEYFLYLPSFFNLSYLVYNIEVYFIFLILCTSISFLILLKLDQNKFMNLGMFLISLLTIMSGNIDIFIFLIILISLRYQKFSPFLLGFVSFKPTVILVLPYFLYRSEKRIKFMLFYGLVIILTNYYFLFNLNAIWIYYNYTFNTFDMGLVFLRPYWIYYVYYYCFASIKLELKTVKIEEKIHLEKLYLEQHIQSLKESIIKKRVD